MNGVDLDLARLSKVVDLVLILAKQGLDVAVVRAAISTIEWYSLDIPLLRNGPCPAWYIALTKIFAPLLVAEIPDDEVWRPEHFEAYDRYAQRMNLFGVNIAASSQQLIADGGLVDFDFSTGGGW